MTVLLNVQSIAYNIVMNELTGGGSQSSVRIAERINEVTNILMRMYVFLKGGAIGAQG